MVSRGKTLVAVLTLGALAICAFAAASAPAVGLTAVTCREVVNGNYNNSHCKTPQSSGNYETVALPAGEPTELESGSETEPVLRAMLGGVKLTVKCKEGHVIEGSVENHQEFGVHEINGEAARVTYTGCHALLKTNEARYCSVKEVTGPNPGTVGMISTTPLQAALTGHEHDVIVEPEAGVVLAEFTILKKGSEPNTEKECFFTGNIPIVVKGSVEGEVNGEIHSHLTFTEANNGGLLEANGLPASYLDTIWGAMIGTENTVGAETF
jgi:hypothetical protein